MGEPEAGDVEKRGACGKWGSLLSRVGNIDRVVLKLGQ